MPDFPQNPNDVADQMDDTFSGELEHEDNFSDLDPEDAPLWLIDAIEDTLRAEQNQVQQTGNPTLVNNLFSSSGLSDTEIIVYPDKITIEMMLHPKDSALPASPIPYDGNIARILRDEPGVSQRDRLIYHARYIKAHWIKYFGHIFNIQSAAKAIHSLSLINNFIRELERNMA